MIYHDLPGLRKPFVKQWLERAITDPLQKKASELLQVSVGFPIRRIRHLDRQALELDLSLGFMLTIYIYIYPRAMLICITPIS